MCSIANQFDTNIRKFDPKKTFFFFLSRMVRLCKSLGKINFLKEHNFSDFSHKNGGVGKIGGVVLKKGEYHLFSY